MALFAVALRMPCPVAAQDALVLGGGGSRGLAHAGAIAGLEQRGFRPQLVVGTSMGAIVGALYASGLTPDSIRAMVLHEQWQELFAPALLAFGPRWSERRPMIRLGIGVDRTRYEEGIIADFGVNRLLVRLLFEAGARANNDFDRLARRYRAMAVDVRTGESVVLAHGDLARAVRASMAVPGVFAAVTWAGRTLVDGGVADYLPVGPARALGAQRVVAVDPVIPRDDIGGLNPFQLAVRGFRLTMRNARPDNQPPDLLITPDINPDIAGAIFLRDPEPLIRAGRDAARRQAPQFGPAGAGQPATLPPAPRTLRRLDIETNDPSLEPLIRRAFGTVIGEFNAALIVETTDRLYGTGLFSGIWPRVERERDDDTMGTLIVRADALPARIVSSAVNWDTDREVRAWAAVEQRILGPGQAAFTVQAGKLDRFASLSLLTPFVSRPRIAVDLGLHYIENDVRAFAAEQHVVHEVEVRHAGGWLGIAWHGFRPDLTLRTGACIERVEHGPGEGLSAGPYLRFGGASKNARIVGIPTLLEGEWRFGDVAWRRVSASGSIDWTRGPLLAAALLDVTATSADAPADLWPALGDEHALPGLRWGEQRQRARIMGGIDLAHATLFEAFLRLRLRAGAVAPELADVDQARWLAGSELGIVWWTPLGGLALDFGANTRGDRRITLSVGPTF
jgi:NTE family protein